MTSHVVYGLFHPMSPRIIRYVGSSRADRLEARLEQHRQGKVKTTAKMSAKSGVPLAHMKERILDRWTTGNSTEYRVMRLCQAFGLARWNHPYAFSSEDLRKGGRKGAEWTAKTPELASELNRTNGRKGGLKSGRKVGQMNAEKWAANPETHREMSRKAGPRGAVVANHNRWHVNRGVVNPDCPLCAFIEEIE